jgi:hypothetical protein
MTILDDYDPPFRMRGIAIARDMLRVVDVQLLKRTRIDALLTTVSNSCTPFCAKLIMPSSH